MISRRHFLPGRIYQARFPAVRLPQPEDASCLSATGRQVSLPWLTAVLLLAAGAGVQAVQQTEPARKSPRSASPAEPLVVSTAAPETPAGLEVSVQEAIQLAMVALERLENDGETDAAGAILSDANRYIEFVRASEPANPWLPYLVGRVYVITGRHRDAVEELGKFVETPIGRNEWLAYRILGDLLVSGFPRLAKNNYARAADLNVGEPSVLFGLSSCAAQLGAAAEAIQRAREAVAADGGRTVRYISHLANLLRAVGKWDEAIGEAERALDLAKQAVGTNPGTLGPLLTVDGQYELLIEIMQGLLEQNVAERTRGGSADATYLATNHLRLAAYIRERAIVADKLARHDVLGALEAGVNRTAPLAPPALLEQYGMALAEVDRIDSAVAVFEQLLAADPHNAVAADWLGRLRPKTIRPDKPEQP